MVDFPFPLLRKLRFQALRGIVRQGSGGAMGAYHRYLLVIVVTIALLAILDAALLPHSNISIAPGTAASAASGIAMGAALFGVGLLFRLPIGRMSGALKDVLAKISEGLESLGVFFALLFVFQIANGLYMYLAAATQRPLMDAAIAAGDRSIGFNWPAVVEAANSSTWLAAILVACYTSILYQGQLVFLFHATIGGRERFFEFAALMVVTLLFTTTISMFFPAAGAYAYYHPAATSYSHYTATGGLDHLTTLHRLRSLAPFEFSVETTIGLISFPSFHTTLGLLVVYAMRRTVLFWPIVLVNALMILGTIPEGGHHLMDIIGGAVVAVVSITLIRWIGREASVATAPALAGASAIREK
jgi:membrane-associated phospholipid phosphatase